MCYMLTFVNLSSVAISSMSQMICILLVFTLSFPLVCSSYDKVPISLKRLASNKISIAGIAAGTAVLGKYIADGPKFTENVDMNGKVVVITGKEAAVKLGSLGAEVIILCKSEEKAVAAVEDIKRRSGSSKIKYLLLNLAKLDSVDECAKRLTSSVGKIDVLMNNAGVMALPQRELTSDGFEAHLGVNHLGHFALTGRLLPLLKKANDARIVNIASAAHIFGHLNFDDLMLERKYEPWPAYGNSKLANILYTKELASRLKDTGITSVCCHPGVCFTDLGRYAFNYSTDQVPGYLNPALGVFFKTAEQGAQTQIFLSATKKLSTRDSGKYFDNSREADTSAESKDMQVARRLWLESEKLTGVKYA